MCSFVCSLATCIVFAAKQLHKFFVVDLARAVFVDLLDQRLYIYGHLKLILDDVNE